jgi:DNA-binding transcriptional ArsR family regulator
MIEGIISSKTRIRLLVKFFLNPAVNAYLRELASEFGESTNGIRVELNRLSEAGLLESEPDGKTIRYRANNKHPLFPDLKAIVGKYTGLDALAQQVFNRLGDLQAAYLVGDYAQGRDSGIIDVILVGKVDEAILGQLIQKAESLISRRIRCLAVTPTEWADLLVKKTFDRPMLAWARD